MVPYGFASLRTTASGRPVFNETAATSSVAAPSGAARWSVLGGKRRVTSRASSSKRSGLVRNRNLSK